MTSRAEALAKALTKLQAHFPTDEDMHEAGWDPIAICAACDAYTEARAALEAYRSQPDGWRPISEEDQVKSGERAWLLQDGEVFSGYYCVISHHESRDSDGRYIDHTDHDEFWMSDDGDIKEPTHIHPMVAPAPPNSKEQQ